MKVLNLIAVCYMTLSTTSAALVAQETPILDRNLFFGNPQISSGQLSPDGKLISFMKAYNGIMNIWVKEFDEPFENARPLTDSPRPLYGYSWTEDGRYILYAKDKDGDENINVFAVDPHATTATGEIPDSRNLTPLNEVTAQIVHVSQSNPDLVWVSLNDRDKAWHDLYQLRISTGELTLLYENNDRITGYEFDWDDNLRLLNRTDEKGNTTLLRIDGDRLTSIYETLVTEAAGVTGWDPQNNRFYLLTNKGELDLLTLYLMDPATTELKFVESDPEKRVDFGSLRLDRNTREVISTSYTDDRTRHYWKNSKWGEMYQFLCDQFPGREVSFQSSTNDYSKFLIAVSGDRYAAEAWFFDAESRELIHQYTPRPELKKVEEHLAPMESVRYASSDGLEIPGYLTIPRGVEPKNLPVVVLVHGGPKGPRDEWGYDPQAQFLANRGYAVLQPNFRASGGYGKAFMNAGDLQWGRLMQDDITWGVKYLIEKGIADKERVAIMGGSYGGYATLAGLAFTPDVYACGVDIVGPSNIFTLLDSVPPYWEAGRAFLYGMVGDPNTEEGRELIEKASPLFSADKIKKPLLIIQGANDPRVKQAEADQIVIALREHGHDVSYLLADDEGHGFAKPVNRMAMFAEVERFLANKLGGRYQADMPEDVAQRLSELRVDISTVTYTPPEAIKPAGSLPKLDVHVREGIERWESTIEVQGQSFNLVTERTITKQGSGWTIKDASHSPALGESIETGVYGQGLEPISRTLEQAGQKIEIRYEPDKVVMTSGDQHNEMAFEGAIICEGPGRAAIIAGLPLEEGYEIAVKIADAMMGKIETHKVHVEGSQLVNGKDHYKVLITNINNPAHKTTIWIEKGTRQATRVEQILPAFGNAKLTMERAS